MDKIYQLKITLYDSKPPIWRRVLVPEDINLHKLHEVIQTVMGWEDEHLYLFEINGREYQGQPEYDEENSKENKVTRAKKLNQLVKEEKQKFDYVYDFGDTWDHTIILEKILDKEEGKFYPVCIKGKNACPPENIGGIWGYYEYLERFKNGELTDEELEYTFGDEDFDPEEFNLEEINEDLKEYFS